jgi:hypothetical protein
VKTGKGPTGTWLWLWRATTALLSTLDVARPTYSRMVLFRLSLKGTNCPTSYEHTRFSRLVSRWVMNLKNKTEITCTSDQTAKRQKHFFDHLIRRFLKALILFLPTWFGEDQESYIQFDRSSVKSFTP